MAPPDVSMDSGSAIDTASPPAFLLVAYKYSWALTRIFLPTPNDDNHTIGENHHIRRLLTANNQLIDKDVLAAQLQNFTYELSQTTNQYLPLSK
jgi:hypothetical protein